MREGRAAKSTVEDGMCRKIGLHIFPVGERGAADEQDGFGGRWLQAVGLPELTDLIDERLCQQGRGVDQGHNQEGKNFGHQEGFK